MMIINPYRFGGVAPPSGFTWDPSAKGPDIILSDGNLAAEKVATGYRSVYGTVSKTSGKWQFEVEHVATLAANGPIVGLADKSNQSAVFDNQIGLTGGISTQQSLGWRVSGHIYKDLTGDRGLSAVGTASSLGDIIGITLDLTLGTPQFAAYKNGTLLGIVSLPSSVTWFPATSVRTSGKVKLKTTLVYPVSGFTQWA